MTTTDYNKKYLTMFNNFFEKGVTVSTYKPIFLRALADIDGYGNADLVGSQWIRTKNGKIEMDLDFIAVRFAKYYWDMEMAFKMRHIPERMGNSKRPKQDLIIIDLVKNAAVGLIKNDLVLSGRDASLTTSQDIKKKVYEILAGEKPPTLEKIASASMKEFRQDVITKAIKPEVLKNLLNDVNGLYERVGGKNYIVFEPELIKFMKEFSMIIKKALNYILAIHLEKNNPTARHIAVKIDHAVDFDSKIAIIKKLESMIEQQKPRASLDDMALTVNNTADSKFTSRGQD